jgi:carbohydrate-selective porin OprB
LWSGGALFSHYEANWGTSINGDVGSNLPANFDATMPRANNPPSAKLAELYYLQALPNNLLASFGKQDMASWADTNLFADNVRTQFSYLGLVDNPIDGVFFPYTGIGAWLDWAPSKEHNLVGVWSQSDAKAGQTGFDNLFNSDNSYAVQYVYSPTIAKKPGNYLIAALYSTKDVTEFAIPRRQLLGELVGALPVAEESNNYGVIANFSQYLWVDHDAPMVSGMRPVGVGLFARAGWEPEDRNVIDQFYSFGIGGYGALIPGRNSDNWGIGWAGSHISDDLRQLTDTFRGWEHAFEVFYNFALTPAIHWTFNAQAIRPADKTTDTAYTLGARLQLDF